MFGTRWNARIALLIEGSAWGGARRWGARALPATPHPCRARATRHFARADAPPRARFLRFVRTRWPHPALKRVAGVSILRRWRGGRAANCTGLENRRVFTHVGSNPTPSAREQRSRRRGCYSNPGLSLRCFASSAHLRTAGAGLGCESHAGRRDPSWNAGGMPTEAVQRASATSWCRAQGDSMGRGGLGGYSPALHEGVQPWLSSDPHLSWWFFLP